MLSGVNVVAKTAPMPPPAAPPRPSLSPEGHILPTAAAKAAAAEMAPSQPGVLCVICQSIMGDEPREALWCTHTFHQSCLREWRFQAGKGPLDCPHRCRPAPGPSPLLLESLVFNLDSTLLC